MGKEEYVFAAIECNKLSDFIMGKLYPFEMTHYAGDDWIPSSMADIAESVYLAYVKNHSVKGNFEKTLKKLLKSDDYSFAVALKTVYMFKVQIMGKKDAFSLSKGIEKLLKEEYEKRAEGIREHGIILYSGTRKYPTGEMKRMMALMEEM